MTDTPAAPRVFIVDDDVDMRDSLAYLLGSVGIAHEGFGSATDFLARFHAEAPGCLVCDVRMPDMSGLELYERIVERGGILPVIFMTAYADVQMAVRALKSGAAEFVEKPFHAQTMLERIQAALVTDQRRRAEWNERRSLQERFESLTAKERETLSLILAGDPNKAIAAKLGVSERAIEMRRASLMKKLRAHSLAELIRHATLLEMVTGRSHLTPPPP